MLDGTVQSNDKRKFIEKRTACIPTNCHDRIGFAQYLELLATLFVCITNIHKYIRNETKIYNRMTF